MRKKIKERYNDNYLDSMWDHNVVVYDYNQFPWYNRILCWEEL